MSTVCKAYITHFETMQNGVKRFCTSHFINGKQNILDQAETLMDTAGVSTITVQIVKQEVEDSEVPAAEEPAAEEEPVT